MSNKFGQFASAARKSVNQDSEGKFIDFDILLPQTFPPSATDDYVMQVTGDDLGSSYITLVPRSQSHRAKVSDFYMWLQAWCCVFVRAFCRYHRHRRGFILPKHYGPIWATIFIFGISFISQTI